ncbi:MAG: DsbA family oxidoreductase [Myxococcota bacterium]|nr:DsbA family oxidoreductase [Myxococcota bacterium]
MSLLRIDVWSDIACPWCYVGKRRLEAALEAAAPRNPPGGTIEVVWRAFELDTSAPRVLDTTVPYAERLAKKYRTSPAQAQGMIDQMTKTAAADGLDFHFEKIQPGNTFDAHRLVHLGLERGVQDAVKERFLRAYLEEGAAIGDRDVLVKLAHDAGLDEPEAAEVLATDRYAAEVRADEAQAREYGISGVPFFVIGGRLGVSGAQPTDVLAAAIAQGWQELGKLAPFAEGAACGPDGC